MAETDALHQRLELGLRRVHADGLGQVAVAVRIAGDQRPDARQHLEGVPVVRLAQRLGHLRELQHQQPAAGTQHAVHLGQRLVLVGHVAQAEGHADQVEGAVLVGQRLGVAEVGGQHQALVDQALAAGAQHRLVDVGVHDHAALADLLGEQPRHVAGAAGDVQHAVARLEVGHGQRVALPGAVQAHRHQVVHDVVARSDRVEHAAHAPSLGGLVDGLEAEMGGAHGDVLLNGGRRGDGDKAVGRSSTPVNGWRKRRRHANGHRPPSPASARRGPGPRRPACLRTRASGGPGRGPTHRDRPR